MGVLDWVSMVGGNRVINMVYKQAEDCRKEEDIHRQSNDKPTIVQKVV